MNWSAVEMWSGFLLAHPEVVTEPGAPAVTAWAFGAGPEMETELAELVLSGRKRATASSLQGILTDGDPLPRLGTYSVILDGTETARCIIRTTAVTVTPLNQVTETFAATEGEGDGSLAYWLDGHRRFFRREHDALSIPFHDAIPVICEKFDVVWPVVNPPDTNPPER
ncbi:MAG: ASCH domain-containing protein [Spirochaeta sp.]|jgi:uncharacterized protein YhfF|nr:ASCH domain-containing protein [Spirochaeta sp.]